MAVTAFDIVQANQFIGASTPDVSAFNKIIYVDGTNGSNGNDGRSPSSAVASVGQAITLAAAGDHVVIAPGTYTITASLVPLARMVFRAAIIVPRAPTVVITGNIADLIQVDVSGTQWHGIEIKASGATADNLMDVADGAAVAGLVINNCVFNGADQTSVVGLSNQDATFAGTQLQVTNTIFRNLTGTMVKIGVLGMAHSLFAYNTFKTDVNSGNSFSFADTTAFATGAGFIIEHNDFIGFDATRDEVAIAVSGTEDTTGFGMIRNNYFTQFTLSTVITQNKFNEGMINNYVGDTATGGTLYDPGT